MSVFATGTGTRRHCNWRNARAASCASLADTLTFRTSMAVTLGGDRPKALAELDRGYENAIVLTPSNDAVIEP